MVLRHWLHTIKQPSAWFILGAIILAAHPVLWLISTWTEPAYDSNGLWVFALVAGLFVWSYRSPLSTPHQQRVQALGLLVLSTLLRLIGQLLAVNSIAALTLVVDVYALALLFGLHTRKNVVSPFWLAILFGLSLPLERILQRTIGYLLQQVSASGACEGLSLFNNDVVCHGVRILMAGQDVLVDLPCSGARSLLLLLLSFVVVATLKRPTVFQAGTGFAICIASAVATNIVRIMFLAWGIAYPEQFAGINVMSSPWHDVIGLVALAIGLLPILLWASSIKHRAHTLTPTQNQQSTNPLLSARFALPLGLAFCALAVSILHLPARPIDIAQASAAPHLPAYLINQPGLELPLTKLEQDYFNRYGGGASRKRYGGNTLLVVNTSAPLRHLHAPDECLRGGGHQVDYIGMDNRGLPTAIYRSIDPQGQQWRIRVSFVSNSGAHYHSVAAAVWHWLQNPHTTWSQIQRITPWSATDKEVQRFDTSVQRALDLGTSFQTEKAANPKGDHYISSTHVIPDKPVFN